MNCKRTVRIFRKFDRFTAFFISIHLCPEKVLKVFQKLFHILGKRALLKNSEFLLPLSGRLVNTCAQTKHVVCNNSKRCTLLFGVGNVRNVT